MGPGTETAGPAGAIPRSLFKKQSAREAHGSDFGIPEHERRSGARPGAAPDGAPSRSEPRSSDSVSENKQSLFRKNTLDEMTVRRTEKPVESVKPSRPDPSRLAEPVLGLAKGKTRGLAPQDEDGRPVRRETVGRGSYEDPADESARRRRSKKTGRPGQ
jgi:excinuclease ABC subunit B